MRIMDVQKFVSEQYRDNERRRVSQHMRFIDKHVDFMTYFSINKVASTTSIGNFTVDSYIGKDSPVRYNVIYNFPLYGFPLFTNENSYGEDEAGLNMDDYSGEVIMLPGLIEPSEGDCFILDMFDPNRFFIITEVRQIVLKGKSHYILSFAAGIPDYLDQLKSQVVDKYNAIFDNIGTEDRVVISNKDYQLLHNYRNIYKELYEYYIEKFFNKRKTLFQCTINISGNIMKFTDVFCTKFMEENRIIVMDDLLKESLMLDYNKLYDKMDFFEYKKTLFAAIIQKDKRRLEPYTHIVLKKMISPFSLSIAQNNSDVYISDNYSINNIEIVDQNNPYLSLEFDFADIVNRINTDDFHISDDEYDKTVSLIVRYMNNDVQINPGYFSNINYDEMTDLQQYMLIPIILFIIRYNINGLTHLNNII